MGTWFWIVLAVLAVLLLSSSGKRKKNGNGSSGEDGRRVGHLHYIDPDEYECPVCHATFKRNVMVCPQCGTRFTGTREDMTAYDDELEEELEMDEWDEEEN